MASEAAARFKALMAVLPRTMKKTIEDELIKQAADLADLMRRAVPVKSGALRDSVRVERTPGRELSVQVAAGGAKTTRPVRKGATATYDYALGQEFGNEHSPAQPFFFPSYRLSRPRIRRGINKAVRRVIDDASAS